MKTYTAEEFEVEFYRAMHGWVVIGKNGVDPRENWEFLISEGKWRSPCVSPSFISGVHYRWKPATKRTVIIDGVELVAPETVAPPIGTKYFIPSTVLSTATRLRRKVVVFPQTLACTVNPHKFFQRKSK